MRWSKREITARRGGQLPMTSMIDVVFLLLVFFLLTARFVATESELTAALGVERSGGGRAADLRPQVIRVQVGDEGQPVFRLGERIVHDRASLTSLLMDLPREAGVFVRPDGDAPVEATVAALQACEDAGFYNRSYVAGD